MSVFSEAAASVGIPGWGVAVSSGIVLLANQVNGSMRPEAKAAIGKFLEHSSLPTEAPSVTGAITAAFMATFGDRQWSLRCLRQTFFLSMFSIYSLSLLIWFKHAAEIRARLPGLPSLPVIIASSLIGVMLFSLVMLLYVGKTRLILRGMRTLRGSYGLSVLMIIDLLLTYTLNMLLYWGPALAIFGKANLCETMQYNHPDAKCSAFESSVGVVTGIVSITAAMTERIFTQAESLSPANILNYAEGCTTMLTSIWTVLIVMAMVILRLVSPLAQAGRFIRWGWDIPGNPVMAVGWIVAVLVFLSSFVYSIV